MLLFVIYYLLSPILFSLILLISPFNKKIKTVLQQQKKSLQKITEKLNTDKKKIIIHAASAGEYEQIKPLLRIIDKSTYFVIVTCMSPTIYKTIQEDQLSDAYCYHSFDFPWFAKHFFEIINPSIYLTTRHDVWPIHLYIAKKMNIKTIIINANLYNQSKRLKWFSIGFTKHIFNMFDLIIVPTKNIKKIFKNSLQINNTHIIYDTRFDQVIHRKENSNEIPEFQLIGKDNIIFGSISWEDLEIISSTLQNKSSNNITDGIIIVPHEIDLKLIIEIEKICQNSTSFSKVRKLSNLKENSNVRVIIVDKVGILPELYKYSRFAYVGGGFGYGVHSTIEPLVYNNIVCYGPNIDLLDEAKEMHQKGCGFIINNGIEFYNKYLESTSPSETNNIRQNIQKYLNQKGSSAEKIYNLINEYV